MQGWTIERAIVLVILVVLVVWLLRTVLGAF